MKIKVENEVTILSNRLKEFFGEKAAGIDQIRQQSLILIMCVIEY